MGEYNRYSNDEIRCVRFKREVEEVQSISLFDKWNNPPTQAVVHFSTGNASDTSKPLKIYHRKNSTHYICFDGKRYDVDITSSAYEQFITSI